MQFPDLGLNLDHLFLRLVSILLDNIGISAETEMLCNNKGEQR